MPDGFKADNEKIVDFAMRRLFALSNDSEHKHHDMSIFWPNYYSHEQNPMRWCTEPQTYALLSLSTHSEIPYDLSFTLNWLWADKFGNTRNQITFRGIQLDGYKEDTAHSDKISTIATEQVAASFYAMGLSEPGDYFINQMRGMESAIGGLLEGGSNDWNEQGFKGTPSTLATAWHFLNLRRHNPFTNTTYDVKPYATIPND